jgi:hypothetical protein
MKFLEIFKPITKGNFGLTDEAIYTSIQYGSPFLPVWGGTDEHVTVERLVSQKGKTKYGEPITTFSGEGIILSLEGSSGSMTYVKGKEFALNHHATFMQLRDDVRGQIDPVFFSLFFQNQLNEASVSEGGSKTLSKRLLESQDFELPSYDTQKMIMQRIRPLLEKRKSIEALINRIKTLKVKELSADYKSYQGRNISISEVLVCVSGNSGLTEEEIYQRIISDGERYDVLSSSTMEETRLGKIPKGYLSSGKELEVIEDKEGILVVRNGKAGSTFFIDKGKYALTDHAYFLTLRQDCKYQVKLKWLMVQYSQLFFDYVSSPDNATWNKTGFFQSAKVDIPLIEEQLEILREYEKLDLLEQRLRATVTKINQLFNRQIVGEAN